MTRAYGYIPDSDDHRDRRLSLADFGAPPPESVDLRPQMPLPPFDQGQLSSCVWNASAAAVVFAQQKHGCPIIMPSRLYGYWFTRYLEGGIDATKQDSGCQIRDAFKAANRWGGISESIWPYDINAVSVQPPPIDVATAQAHKPLEYMTVEQNADAIKRALAGGYPIIFGMSVYESFESDAVAATGIVPMPLAGEKMVGRHCTLMMGYNEKYAISRNSWGVGFGDQGHFYLPLEDFVCNPDLVSDPWVLERAS
jgi:C1A family cysteine protease